MWKKLAAAFVAVVTVATSTTAVSGPFGISLGDPISKYKSAQLMAPGIYKLSIVPIPRDDLDYVVLTATPQQGICKISASSKNFEDDAYGEKIQNAFADVKRGLAEKYGSSRDFDFLKAGAIWDQPREYAMSLKTEERTLTSYWMRDDGSNLPPDVQIISLEAVGLSSDVTYWRVTYQGFSFEACHNEIERQRNDAL